MMLFPSKTLSEHRPRPFTAVSLRFTFIFLLLLLLPLGVLAESARTVDVLKSPNDDRDYRYLVLPNQLQVLLVSDPGTEKAAAALDVFVGSASDPADRQGLAHFLEHMLFLGTEKYPRPDEYQAFIKSHGGENNAYTSFEHTNYFFDVEAEHLEPALDRFAQFFIAPRFSADYVDRERHAVHSEYQSRLKDEYRRTLDVYRQVMNPQSPLNKFSVGSLATLDDGNGSLRRDLQDFYQRYYKARNMGLVVLGRQELDQLESMVRERFAQITNKQAEAPPEPAAEQTPSAAPQGAPDLQPAQPLEPVFLPRDLPMRLKIRPARELRELNLMFPIPPVEPLYRKKPAYYLGNFLGHEGEGSLLSLLKSQGWAESLSAGTFLSTEQNALFQISIGLTEAGLAHQEAITGLVFAAIDRISRGGIEEWRFEELQRLGEIAFRFQEKASPLTTVRTLAPNLHYYEPAEVIAGDYLLQEYDPKLIRRFADFLNPGNVVVSVVAPDLETDRRTPYFDTPFSVKHSPLKLAEVSPELSEELKLPEPNPFIPRDLTLKPKSIAPGDAELAATHPTLLKDASRAEIWFKQDQKFQVPRTSAFLRIKSPEAASSLQGFTLMQLYTAMLRDSFNEYAYPARLAGLDYSIRANSRGLDVVVTGYSDGQDRLFKRIVEQMHRPRFSRERFFNVKRELLREWRNFVLEQPYQQLLATMPTLLFSPWWSNEQQIQALIRIDFDELKRFVDRAYVDSRAELLFYGNLTRAEAARLAGTVEVELLKPMADKTLPAARVVKLDPAPLSEHAPVFARTVKHNDKAVVLYVQGKDDSIAENARVLLLQQVLSAPFFHQLRTEQQLGYVVFASGLPFKDVPGTIMVVQSPRASLEKLQQAIGKFASQSAELVPSDLALHKSAVVNELMEPPKNLHEQASRYWESIVDDDDSFDRRERLAEAVMAITNQELSGYITDTLVQQPRALWVLAGPDPFASAGKEASGESAPKPSGEADWMPIEQWPIFKAERKSYLYP